MKLLLPRQIQRITEGDKVVFFNPDIPSWVVTDSNGATLLSLCDGTMTAEEMARAIGEEMGAEAAQTVHDFLRHAVEARLFDMPSPEEVPVFRSADHLGIVQFSISSRCNLNCRYCYATDRVESRHPLMTLRDYQRVVDEVCAMSPSVKFTLTGGEPLLNADCIAIARYIKAKGHDVDLLTNATLINAQNIDEVCEAFDMVTVSIDGSNSTLHESLRGPHSYERAEKAIALLLSHEMDTRVSMTVNRLNIHDVEAMAQKYGPMLSYAPLFPAGNARGADDLSVTGAAYFEALRAAHGVNPLSYCESALDGAQQYRNCKCAMGDGELSFSPTGDVYPCQLLHYPEFLIGNIFEDSVSHLYHHSPVVERCRCLTVDNIEGCAECFLKYVCGGACRARAYHECGNIASSGNFCEYEKRAFIDGILRIYSHNKMEDHRPEKEANF